MLDFPPFAFAVAQDGARFPAIVMNAAEPALLLVVVPGTGQVVIDTLPHAASGEPGTWHYPHERAAAPGWSQGTSLLASN